MGGNDEEMSRAVLISIHPKWCVKIARGEKTIEVRKTHPKVKIPFKCYIYCTNTKPYLVWGDVFRGDWETEFTAISGYNRKSAEEIWDVFNGNIIGEFVCEGIEEYHADEMLFGEYDIDDDSARTIGLTGEELWAYGQGKTLYGWHISDLVIYDKPKELGEFYKVCPSYGADFGICWECENAVGEECTCGVNGQIAMTQPPQSWCYVEEVQSDGE